MSFRLSNNLLGILNFVTFLLSIPILVAGIWLSRKAITECERFLDKPIIIVGVFLMVISLAGFVGACCHVKWFLWLYLVVMLILIVLGIAGTIFAFVVTNKGAGRVLSGKGYKEYRLGDYSNWLQKRVGDENNWFKIKSCLVDSKVCTEFHNQHINESVKEFYKVLLSSIQSGCCKPSNDCQFTFLGPTNWTKGNGVFINNSDCNTWSNDLGTLCFNCQACKAGFIDNLKSSWKKVMVVNIIFLVCLIIVYSVGCCAFSNSRKSKS
ncbi:hypothetical protein ES332_A08G278600v1 [Gossypium tomentosum]|uniref:Tetraspanin-8-like n=1 Tax=Gossypium tomentosum TaxID=34277 RepID=A0A5D2PL60_GOSTO|nr:hypothetical protein ES332_A08G278600v1 [Gossypium tomentosum]